MNASPSNAINVRPGLAFKPIAHPDELAVLQEAARIDDHQLIMPTHGLWRDGTPAEPVGYASLCVTPVLHVWMHTQKLKPRDSFASIRKLEQMARESGHGMIVVPCGAQSPFYKLMPAMGYEPFLETTLFAKNLPADSERSLRRRD